MSLTKEQYLERLSQVAEWKIQDVTTEKGQAPRKRGRPSAEDLYQEQHQREFLDIHKGNPTLPVVITKVKVAGSDCSDCGKWCEQGQRQELKKYLSPKPHWRKRCVNCNLFLNPETGKYDIEPTRATSVYGAYHRKA